MCFAARLNNYKNCPQIVLCQTGTSNTAGVQGRTSKPLMKDLELSRPVSRTVHGVTAVYCLPRWNLWPFFTTALGRNCQSIGIADQEGYPFRMCRAPPDFLASSWSLSSQYKILTSFAPLSNWSPTWADRFSSDAFTHPAEISRDRAERDQLKFCDLTQRPTHWRQSHE